MTTFPTDSLMESLLERIADVETLITGVAKTSPHLYDALRGPWPAVYNYIARITPDYTPGTSVRLDIVDVGIRIVYGPLTAGEQAQYEILANTSMQQVINLFDYRPYLQHPTTNDPFRYIDPIGCQMLSVDRLRNYKPSPQSGEELLANEFVLRVPILVNVARLS